MDNSNTINILCATDENYAPYCGIMLTSLFESNRDCHFNVFVLVDGTFSDDNVKKYNLLGKKYGNEVVLKTVEESMVKGFPTVEGWVTLPTYYRLLASEMLPEDISKIIYFDGDIIVKGDIKPLWNVNLDGMAIACSRRMVDWRDKSFSERLGYNSYDEYFNAGVLVINLDFWRTNGITNALLDYIRINIGNKSKLLYMDQDALNVVLHDKKFFFPERYNFHGSIFLKRYWMDFSEDQLHHYFVEYKSAVVIHYTGGKPWDYKRHGGPFFSDWEKYRRKSLWRDCRNTKPFGKHVKHLIKRYLFPKLFRSQHSEWVMQPEIRGFNKKFLNFSSNTLL